FSFDILIETGTAEGEMINATKNIFKKIYSIELDELLYEYTKKRFSKDNHISLYQGDSTKVLPTILSIIKKPCLFWLDAHYSGGITAKGNLETPIISELNSILDTKLNHVILIDDARLFIGKNDYPTIKEVKELLMKKKSNWVLEVSNDIIRIHKKI
ncbi:MAG: FkbM family methyltransferase, partial [Promethearchaeota archaeon]